MNLFGEITNASQRSFAILITGDDVMRIDLGSTHGCTWVYGWTTGVFINYVDKFSSFIPPPPVLHSSPHFPHLPPPLSYVSNFLRKSFDLNNKHEVNFKISRLST